MTDPTRLPNEELTASRAWLADNVVPVSPEDAEPTYLDAEDVTVLQLEPARVTAERSLLYFHGGGYRQGSPAVFAAQLARISRELGATIFAVQYPLAPERPFPAALDTAVQAYAWLTKTKISADRLILWGDSAGGGLAASLLLRLQDEGHHLPAGAALVSPWLDLRVTAPSFTENAQTDELFSAARATEAAADYIAEQDPTNPFISPLLGDWAGQPPLLLLVSRIEVLRDDSIRLAETAAAAGVPVRLEVFPDTQHIWPTMDFPRTDEAVRAVHILGEFLTSPGPAEQGSPRTSS